MICMISSGVYHSITKLDSISISFSMFVCVLIVILSVLLIITNFYLYGITTFRFPNDNTKKPFDSIQFSDDPEIRQGLCRV